MLQWYLMHKAMILCYQCRILFPDCDQSDENQDDIVAMYDDVGPKFVSIHV